MRLLMTAVLLCAVGAPLARAEDAKEPKEINAKGWFNSEGVTLQKLKGKVVVVEFWATWCPPCRASIPHLIALRDRLDKSKVEIVGLTDEPKSKIETFVRDMKMNYTVGYGSTSGQAYGVTGIPHAFVIGADGKIAWEGHPMDAAMAPLVTKLAETVKGK